MELTRRDGKSTNITVELNPHFKPEALVLMCGSSAYGGMEQSVVTDCRKYDPKYSVNWIVQYITVVAGRVAYVGIDSGRVFRTVKSAATMFYSYAEARAVAEKVIESGLALSVSVIEEIIKAE
jgi:hypothetical protein